MKLTAAPLLALLALVTGAALSAAPPVQPAPQLLIDPGHGGVDRGVSLDGFNEADYCLALAQDLQQRLKAVGVAAALTRDSDQSLSLSARVQLADQLQPQAFISLHVNASYQQGASGPRIFVPAAGSVDDAVAPLWEQASRLHAKESRDLGEAVAKSLDALGGHHVQVLKMGLFRGLLVPACVVELGFATDPAGLAGFKDAAQRKALAGRLAEGLAHYLKEAGHAAP